MNSLGSSQMPQRRFSLRRLQTFLYHKTTQTTILGSHLTHGQRMHDLLTFLMIRTLTNILFQVTEWTKVHSLTYLGQMSLWHARKLLPRCRPNQEPPQNTGSGKRSSPARKLVSGKCAKGLLNPPRPTIRYSSQTRPVS